MSSCISGCVAGVAGTGAEDTCHLGAGGVATGEGVCDEYDLRGFDCAGVWAAGDFWGGAFDCIIGIGAEESEGNFISRSMARGMTVLAAGVSFSVAGVGFCVDSTAS